MLYLKSALGVRMTRVSFSSVLKVRRVFASGSLLLALVAAFATAPSAEAMPTPKRCASTVEGVWGIRTVKSTSCAKARSVVSSRESTGHPPLGWNCYFPKRVRGTSYWSRACKLGSAHGGAILRYYVRNPAPYQAAAVSSSPAASAASCRTLTGFINHRAGGLERL